VHQLDYGNSVTSLAVFAGTVRLNQWVVLEQVADGLPQGARTLAMNDSDLAEAGHKSVIQVFIEPGQGFIQGQPAQVYLVAYCWSAVFIVHRTGIENISTIVLCSTNNGSGR
jgi:hypothetical protein